MVAHQTASALRAPKKGRCTHWSIVPTMVPTKNPTAMAKWDAEQKELSFWSIKPKKKALRMKVTQIDLLPHSPQEGAVVIYGKAFIPGNKRPLLNGALVIVRAII